MYNITNNQPIADNYQDGLLPQRNHQNFWYQDTSCRSNLSNFALSSENRRILRKTDQFSYSVSQLPQPAPKIIFPWIKELKWDFPNNSVKTIFSHHLFNTLYTWSDQDQLVAFSICYFDHQISHIAYVFYHPKYSHLDLPIRLTLQVIIDSHLNKLSFCYLGRDHTSPTGYYKRNMPGYEYIKDKKWLKYNK